MQTHTHTHTHTHNIQTSEHVGDPLDKGVSKWYGRQNCNLDVIYKGHYNRTFPL